MQTYRMLLTRQEDLDTAMELASDPDFKDVAQEEINGAKADIERLKSELTILLLPKNSTT